MSAGHSALASADFRKLWIGLLVSNIGTWMQNVAQSWVIYRMTGNDARFLGLLGASFAVPMTLLPLVGGAVADRVDRVKLLYVTQAGAATIAAALAALQAAGALRPTHLLAGSFATAVLLAFANPTRQAIVPDLVPREALASALSLNSAAFTGAALVGPAIAGALLDRVGAAWLFGLNAVSYVAVIATVTTLDGPLPRLPRRAPSRSLRDEIVEGLRYAFEDERVRILLALSAVAAVFARSYQQLLPVFANAVHHAGPIAYGLFLSSAGGGAIIAAFALSARGSIVRPMRTMFAGGAAFATLLGLFALARSFPLALGALILAGASVTVFTTMIATTLQLRAPGPMRGRVMGLYAITLVGLPHLGALGTATVARSLGAPYTVLVGAVVLGAALALAIRARAVREDPI